jgi:hypothetical protein
LPPGPKLRDIAGELDALAQMEHIGLVDLPAPGGGLLRHPDVCGRKAQFTASLKTAREMAQRLVDEYGQRALQAARNEGVDWKALSHAVRVGREAIELFATGRITFPLPDAAHIRRIKAGEMAYAEVADEIERLLEEVEAAASSSRLPEAPDMEYIDALAADAYRRQLVSR